MVDMKTLAAFLYDAKMHTYADDDAKAIALPDGGKRLLFEQGNFSYEDTYYGLDPSFEDFMGTEIVRQNGSMIWMMNYGGGISPLVVPRLGVSTKEIYALLRQALRHVPAALPIRGPESFDFEGSDYHPSYYFELKEGDLRRFRGEESIYWNYAPAYHLSCRGGISNDP